MLPNLSPLENTLTKFDVMCMAVKYRREEKKALLIKLVRVIRYIGVNITKWIVCQTVLSENVVHI